MGDKSNIEWTDATWNPVVGCSITSPGCTNCYAMRQADRVIRMSKKGGRHYVGTVQDSKAGPVWTGKVHQAPDATWEQPLHWQRPRRIFVNSMGDLFHESVPDAWIDRAFAIMALCGQHTFQILTKRAKRMREYMSATMRDHDIAIEVIKTGRVGNPVSPLAGRVTMSRGWPLPNVWLGVSAEDQERANERIPELLKTPAAVRFVSAEPLLGPINFTEIRPPERYELDAMSGFDFDQGSWIPRLDWIIVGGESGPDARPMHPAWVRTIRDHCETAKVPFFFKQWGEWAPGESCDWAATRTEQTASIRGNGSWAMGTLTPRQSEEMHRDDEPDLFRVGRKRALQMIDGKRHNEYPEPRT